MSAGVLPLRMRATTGSPGIFSDISASESASINFFERFVNGRGGEKALFQRGQRGVAIFAQPLSIGLGSFRGSAHQNAGNPGEVAAEAAAPFEIIERKIDLALHVHGLGNFRPRVAELGLLLRIGCYRLAQLFFVGRLLGHERFVDQAGLIALVWP